MGFRAGLWQGASFVMEKEHKCRGENARVLAERGTPGNSFRNDDWIRCHSLSMFLKRI